MLYFEFDGEGYYIGKQALRSLLIEDDYPEAASAFIDKLTNIDKFINDSSIRRLLPEFTADLGAEIY